MPRKKKECPTCDDSSKKGKRGSRRGRKTADTYTKRKYQAWEKGPVHKWALRNRSKLKEIIGEDPISARGTLKRRAIGKIINAIEEGKLKVRARTKTMLLRTFYLLKGKATGGKRATTTVRGAVILQCKPVS